MRMAPVCLTNRARQTRAARFMYLTEQLRTRRQPRSPKGAGPAPGQGVGPPGIACGGLGG